MLDAELTTVWKIEIKDLEEVVIAVKRFVACALHHPP
jgi:hypothetical protein